MSRVCSHPVLCDETILLSLRPEEAEKIMSKSYMRHNSLGDRGSPLTARPSKADLEKLGTRFHYAPVTAGDKFAETAVKALEPLVHMFFKGARLCLHCRMLA